MSRQQDIENLNQKRLTIGRDLERVRAVVRDARNGIRTQAKQAGERVKSDASKTVKNLAEDARDVATHARTDTTAAAKEKVRDAGRRAADAGRRAADAGLRAAEAADPRRVVREQPLIGLAASVGIGFALAMLAPRLTHGAPA